MVLGFLAIWLPIVLVCTIIGRRRGFVESVEHPVLLYIGVANSSVFVAANFILSLKGVVWRTQFWMALFITLMIYFGMMTAFIIWLITISGE